jgi:outer membrane lipoprotein carrier protein
VTSSFAPPRPSRRAPLLLAALALAAAAEPPAEEAALAAVQKRYDSVRDLRARFVQTSTNSGIQEVVKGTVLVQRPGRIRWSYDDGRVIVLDREEIRIYSPEDKQLQVAPLKEGTVSPTALTFLMGGGRLADEFAGRIVPAQDAAGSSGLGLELVPRSGDPSFESLVLWVDPQNHELRESVLVDLLGNRTRIEISSAVYNAGLEPDAFKVRVPEGTDVIDLGKAP